MQTISALTADHSIVCNSGGSAKNSTGFVTLDGVKLQHGASIDLGSLFISFRTTNLNAKEFGMKGNDHIVASCRIILKDAYSFDVLFVENENKSNKPSSQDFVPRFLNINAALLDSSRRPHGILGQTARFDSEEEKKRSVEEWKIEGSSSEYEVKDGLFGRDFAFNRFSV